MSISKLEVAGVDARLLNKLSKHGVDRLTEIQELAVKKGLFRRRNLFICSPASSGKTLLGYIAALSLGLKEPKSKAIFLMPLKSQADETYSNLKKKYGDIGLNIVRLSDKDLELLANSNILIGTYMEMDKALLTGYQWFRDISLIIVDECQLLGQHEKGGLLENLILILHDRLRGSQLILLSDIIGNAFEVSDWLGLELVETYSPIVPVKYSVLLRGDMNTTLFDIIKDTVKANGQTMIFTANQSEAYKLCSEIKQRFNTFIRRDQKNQLETALNMLRIKGEETFSKERLSYFLRGGVAFHLAGLSSHEKITVEELFNNKIIRVVVSTPEIGAGTNMHPRTVIFNDVFRNRYQGEQPTVKSEDKFIDPNIVHNIFGRAGDYRYDREAYGIIIVDNPEIKVQAERHFFKKTITGQLIPNYMDLKSKLLDTEYLGYIILFLIACYGPKTISDVTGHFEKSLCFKYTESRQPTVLEPLTMKTIVEAIAERTDCTTRLNAERISLKHLSELQIREDYIGCIITSPSSSKTYRVQVSADSGPSCDCENWKFKARKTGKYCKHITGLLLLANDKRIGEEAAIAALKSVNTKSVLLDLIVGGYAKLEGDIISLTDKGKLCAYTAISPKLLQSLVPVILDQRLKHKKRILEAVNMTLNKGLVELPYSPVKSIQALEYLCGEKENYPVDFEPGDFKRLLKFLGDIFDSLILVTKYLRREDLEEELLKFKIELEKKINENQHFKN